MVIAAKSINSYQLSLEANGDNRFHFYAVMAPTSLRPR